MTHLFCTLDSQRIADLVRSAERFGSCAGAGVHRASVREIFETGGERRVDRGQILDGLGAG